MVARPQSQCGACERYRSPLSPENTTGLTKPFCAAFPDGIPAYIWNNEFDHRNPAENDHGLQWLARAGLAKFPTYAFDPAVLDSDAMATGSAPLVAAADAASTGAMIALVPTAEHAARLAIEGGELAEDLHCTLIFLGEAADFDLTDREALAKWALVMVEGWTSVEGVAFAPAIFNPEGEDPCAVLVLSGADLAEFYETTLADVTDLVAIPEQHMPHVSHVTIKYLDAPNGADLDPLIDRVGPITFDRLRLAFAGEIIDMPIGTQPVDSVVDDEELEDEEIDDESEEPIAASAAPQRELFLGCPFCLGEAHSGPCGV